MTTLDERAAAQEAAQEATSGAATGPEVAAGVAPAETGLGEDPNAEPRHADARGAGARARVANLRVRAAIGGLLRWIGGLLGGMGRRARSGGTWSALPPLLDSRPRSLREQRDTIRAHRFDRPRPDGTAAANWRQAAEHAYDAGMWVGFFCKALFMTCEWCVERPRRVAVAAAIAAALVRLF